MHMGQFGPATPLITSPWGASDVDTSGYFGARSAGSTRTANLYEGTSSCPAGQSVVERGSKPIRAAFIGAPTSEPFVYCRPIERAAPAPAPVYEAPVYTTTISPVIQTEVSPMISPVFAQMQASPGAVQAGTPTMVSPGGMEATGGGPGPTGAPAPDTAMMDFLRQQEERDAARRAEDAATRERERQDLLAREQRELEYRREQDAYALQLQQQQIEMQRLDQERRAAEEAGRTEEAAALQAQYEQQRLEWEQSQATPPQMVSTTTVMPGREMVTAAAAPVTAATTQRPGMPVPLMVALGAAVLLGGIYYANRGRKR